MINSHAGAFTMLHRLQKLFQPIWMDRSVDYVNEHARHRNNCDNVSFLPLPLNFALPLQTLRSGNYAKDSELLKLQGNVSPRLPNPSFSERKIRALAGQHTRHTQTNTSESKRLHYCTHYSARARSPRLPWQPSKKTKGCTRTSVKWNVGKKRRNHR